jgi:hypothetical protein
MNVSMLLIACVLVVAGSAVPAAAHCCHDDRMLGTASQSEFRRGTHGVGERRLGEAEEEGPSIGRGLGSGGSSLNNGGGLGGMRDGGHGNYGAGSLGERGPGGLGTLRGDSILRDSPRPR